MKFRRRILPVLLLANALLALSAYAGSSESKSSLAASDKQVQPAFNPDVFLKAAATADDSVAKALVDELARSAARLKLENYPYPYLIAYLCKEVERLEVHASFGALNSIDRTHDRKVSVDARVGDYKFDNSGERLPSHSGAMRVLEFPTSIDDNYDAVRHAVWLLTDISYKHAIEAFESKKAILHQKNIKDLPDSYSKTQPLISLETKRSLNIDEEKWKGIAKQVSSVFRSYPAIISSEVEITARMKTHWYANTEGTLTREYDPAILVAMVATGQAADGMEVSDYKLKAATASSDVGLVEQDKMVGEANALAKQVTQLAHAPLLDEDYRGPVLFEKQAAAQFFGQTLTPCLLNAPEPLVHSNAGYQHFSESIGRRILPESITVIDNPLVHEFNGQQLKGNYLIDDEGVQAQSITLVEDGILKTLCSGRTPGKDVKTSNGHWRDGAVFASQLFITSKNGMAEDAMYKKLLQIGKEQGLKYVMVVRRISPNHDTWNTSQTEELKLKPPNLTYQVSTDDGKETLVRGAQFAHLTPRAWRDIVAVGDDRDAYLVSTPDFGQSMSLSLITPSILVSEVDIQRKSNETDTPMILQNPYFEESKTERTD